MKCERLVNLTKSWYVSVKDETMAPARMVQFIKNHISACEICLTDPDINEEVDQITELILPDSKIPKAVRLQQEKESEDEEEDVVDDDGDDGDDDEGDDKDDDTDSDDDDEEEDEEYMDDEDDEEDDGLDELD